MKNLLVLLGPTGVGKTELSLLLAERLGSPIINADSRQIYKDIEIGTASPTAEELARVEHFFVHTLALDEYYSAAEYEKDVMQLLPQLFQSHDTVLLSGGSMMYIDAVTKGIDDIPTVDEETREMLRHRFEKEGLEPLLAEICYMTGKPFTFFRTNSTKERPFRIVKFGLRRERANLFARINARVDKMMEEGLLDEARRVYPLRELNSLNTVGYKEMFKVIAGEWELPMAVERMKKNTRVYAKKQMTWYQHDADIHWLDADKMNIQEMLKTIENEVFVA